MGYLLNAEGFDSTIRELSKKYRLYAPVLKKGEGRFLDTDVVRYDFVTEASQIELDAKSDYAFKEFLTPLSETLFYFTENQVREADLDPKPVIIFLRSCDIHAAKRMDQMYLANGSAKDPFYQRRRDLVHFALIGCDHSYPNCFCASMGSNVTQDGYLFSIERAGEGYQSDVKDDGLQELFAANAVSQKDVVPAHVSENDVKVTVPETIPLAEIIKNSLWDEYDSRCIACGRCNFACPTCTCFTMQDIYYTDNGKVGERRRVGASCMVDGYSTVACGGQYRRKHGERMRFKALHKIYDFRKRFGYDMCVGCGRCDDICPEYISFSNIINKVNTAAGQILSAEKEAE